MIKWRVCEDGIVVYVPATCETYVLDVGLQSFFSNDPRLIHSSDTLISDADGAVIRSKELFLFRPIAEELIDLKIFDLVT